MYCSIKFIVLSIFDGGSRVIVTITLTSEPARLNLVDRFLALQSGSILDRVLGINPGVASPHYLPDLVAANVLGEGHTCRNPQIGRPTSADLSQLL